MQTISGDSRNWSRYAVKKDYWFLYAILFLAVFLRFNHLNEPGLWLDEVYYAVIAQYPIIQQVTNSVGIAQNDPILSTIPLALALKVGNTNYLARFPAAIFGILSVAAIYKLGRTLFENWAY